MRVRQLIKLLQILPQDAAAVICREDGFADLSAISVCKMKRDAYAEDFDGRHEPLAPDAVGETVVLLET